MKQKTMTTTSSQTKAEKVEHKLNTFAKGKAVVKSNLWYGIIGLLSIVILVIVPLIGSGLPIALALPTTAIGWVVYIFTKLAVAALNIMIFHSFMEQGKLNVSECWKKRISDEILHRTKQLKEIIPLSPEQWMAKEYKTKGISIAITSVLSCIILSQVVLTFDILTFLGCLFTLIMGVVFGCMQLFKSEHFWSMDYYDYAIYTLNQFNQTAPEDKQLSVRGKNLYEGENLIYEYE